MRSGNSIRKIPATFAALLIGLGLVGVTSTPALAAAVTDTSSLNAAIASSDPVISISNDFTLDAPISLINYDVEIQGNGHTIDADAYSGFTTNGTSITISNLTVIDPAFSAFDINVNAGESATLTNVSTSDTDYGIWADLAGNGASISITGGTHSAASTAGINVGNSAGDGTVSISGVALTNLATGISLGTNNNTHATIEDSSVTDSFEAINIYASDDSTVDVSNTSLISGPNQNSGTSGYGFSVNASQNAKVTFDKGQIYGHPGTDAFNCGTYVSQSGSGTVSFTNGTIRDSYYGSYISDNSGAGTILYDGMTITSGENAGIYGTNHGGGGSIEITRSTVSNNGWVGAYVSMFSDSEFLVDSSTFSGNVDGGIWADLRDQAHGEVVNSTVSGTTAGVEGGWAVWAGGDTSGSTSFDLLHSTVTSNNVSVAAGFEANAVTISHSIIAGNQIISPTLTYGEGEIWIADYETSDVHTEWSVIGQVVDETGGVGYTEGAGVISGVTDPGLEPLAANGGPTMTHLLKSTSPALNAGNPAIAGQPAYDQRGLARISGSAIDIGAVEMQPSLADTGTDSLYWMLGTVFLLLLTGSGLILVRRRLQTD